MVRTLVILLSFLTLTLNPIGYHSVVMGAEKAESKTVTHSKEEEGKVRDKNLLTVAPQNIALLGAVFLTPLLLLGCFSQPSVLAFSATSAFYVGSEIYNYATYKKASEESLTVVDNAQKDQQLETMQAAGNQTMQAAQKANLKGNFQMSVSIGWGVAAVIAFIEGTVEWFTGKPSACTGYENPYHIPNQFNRHEGYKTFVQNLNESEGDLDALFLMDEFTSFVEGKVSSPRIDHYEKASQLEFFKFGDFIKDSLGSIFEGLIPGAHASEQASKDTEIGSGAAMMGIGGAAAIAVAAAMPAAKAKMLASKTNGLVRGGIFTAMAAIGGIATAETKKVASSLEVRAEKYYEIMRQLQKAILNNPAINENSSKINEFRPIEMGPDPTIKSAPPSCFTGKKTAELKSDEGCSCKKTKTCKKANMPKINFKGFKTPGSLKSLLNSNGKVMDKFYSGDVLGSSKLASQINGQNAARLKKLKRRVQKSINASLKQQGKAEMDFNEMEKNAFDDITGAIKTDLSNMSASQRKDLASFAGGALFPQDQDGKEKKEKSVRGKGGVAAQVKKSSSKGSGKGKGKKEAKKQGLADLGLDFGDDDGELDDLEDQPRDDEESEEAKNAPGLEAYEVEENDIKKDSEANLFKSITTRYLKTAFPILFDEEKKDNK